MSAVVYGRTRGISEAIRLAGGRGTRAARVTRWSVVAAARQSDSPVEAQRPGFARGRG
jgi:hypothetical protein